MEKKNRPVLALQSVIYFSAIVLLYICYLLEFSETSVFAQYKYLFHFFVYIVEAEFFIKSYLSMPSTFVNYEM